jgi:hypothetical protein
MKIWIYKINLIYLRFFYILFIFLMFFLFISEWGYTRKPEIQRITNSVFFYKKFNKKNNFYKIKFIIFIINSLI